MLEGSVCALLATKDHINLFLYDGAIVPDPDGIITSGRDNKTARCIAVYRDQKINVPALTTMLRHIADTSCGIAPTSTDPGPTPPTPPSTPTWPSSASSSRSTAEPNATTPG